MKKPPRPPTYACPMCRSPEKPGYRRMSTPNDPLTKYRNMARCESCGHVDWPHQFEMRGPVRLGNERWRPARLSDEDDEP